MIEERRGQGFFVRRITAGDLADLHRLCLAQLLIAQRPQQPVIVLPTGPDAERGVAEDAPAGSATVRTEALFARWIGEGGARSLLQAHLRLQAQLGPARRLEHLLLEDLETEIANLEAARTGDARRRGLRRYHARRLRVADRLALLLAREERGGL